MVFFQYRSKQILIITLQRALIIQFDLYPLIGHFSNAAFLLFLYYNYTFK